MEGRLPALVQPLLCRWVLYVCMCRCTLDTLQRLRLSSRGTACFGQPSFPSTWYSERRVTKLPTAPCAWIALGCKNLVNKKAWDCPAPAASGSGSFTSGYSHVLSPLPRLTNLVGAGFSVLQPPQILALPPAACPVPPGSEVLPSPQRSAIRKAQWSPGPGALAEQLWLRR